MAAMTVPESAALEVVDKLVEAGHRALFAGGAVRDRLLGREPQDFDVATSATPDEITKLFRHVVPVGIRYGVVIVVINGKPVEVATFRHDSVYRDGRRPIAVTFSRSPREDAIRRDFTVNGLFLDPANGELLDFVDGRRDLDAGIIRAIGDARERFAEDHLRMLRAVRFACSLDFDLHPDTLAAIRELAGEVGSVSAERVRDELIRTFTSPAPGRGLELLRSTGLLAVVLPEVERMVGVEQPPEFHPEGDVFVHTRLLLDLLEKPSPVLAMAGLLHDVGKPPTFVVKERIRFDNHAAVGEEIAREICERLRMSRKEIEQVAELVRDHLLFMAVKQMREAKLRRFLTRPLVEEHMALHRADCLSSHRKLGNWEFCRERIDRYAAEPPKPPRLVRGGDLTKLGLTPGPLFAEILGEVEDRQLEGTILSRQDALEFVRERYLKEK